MKAFIVGTNCTSMGKMLDRSFASLSEEVVRGALSDAGVHGEDVDGVWFGNCGMGMWGQANLRGQIALKHMTASGELGPAPVVNVEAGCATGSLALQGAVNAVRAGQLGAALAVGAEKTVMEDPAKMLKLFLNGADCEEGAFQAAVAERAEAAGLSFSPHPYRVPFLDVHALHALHHMERFGTTAEQLAAIAAKDHNAGSLNEKAQYRFELTVEAVLADKPILHPLTRAMCCPLSDGAAAVVVVSEAVLMGLSAEVRERAVEVLGMGVAGGSWRGFDEANVVFRAAAEAYEATGLAPTDIDVAEVHDATSFCELQATEALGFCPEGEGGSFAASGATAIGGQIPVNSSGGLVSMGHPLGATGLSMIHEITTQLRGEAGARQAKGARIGVTQNAGGMIGIDEAVCAVTVLGRAS